MMRALVRIAAAYLWLWSCTTGAPRAVRGEHEVLLTSLREAHSDARAEGRGALAAVWQVVWTHWGEFTPWALYCKGRADAAIARGRRGPRIGPQTAPEPGRWRLARRRPAPWPALEQFEWIPSGRYRNLTNRRRR